MASSLANKELAKGLRSVSWCKSKEGWSFLFGKKYADRKDAVEYLAKKIKEGGSGVWGNVPMPPQNVTESEARQLAEWIRSLK